MDFPINAGTLSAGLSSANLAVSFPTGVFNFPVGSNRASADVALGSVPKSDTVSPGGAADWTLSANSPGDGQLNISLIAKSGKQITTSTGGGSLVTVSFPVSPAFDPSSATNESITVVAAGGTFHTSLVGTSTYTLSPAPPYAGSVTITPVVEQPPTIPAAQGFTTEANTLLAPPAPGLLSGASDPQGLTMTVNNLNGTNYTPGMPLTLPSGAVLTVNSDGSFTYEPASNFVGMDSFTYTVMDQSGNVSNTATVHLNVTATLSIVPSTISTGPAGTTVEEDVYLDNPDPVGGNGPLASFKLTVTYDGTEIRTASDGSQIRPGPDVPADWTFTANSATVGVLTIGAFGSGTGSDLVTGPAPLELARIDFVIIGKTSATTPIQLVGPVNTSKAFIGTAVHGMSGAFPLNPTVGLAGSPFVPGVDTTIAVQGATPLPISPALLPNGDVNTAYNQTIAASGGAAPYTFALLSGTFPTGLTLDASSGVLAGAPEAIGSYSFTVRATDLAGITGMQNYTVLMNPAVAISTAILPSWTVNQSGYNQMIIVSGGTGSYLFSTSGTLPIGLTMSPSGVLSGTPIATGSFNFTVTATDSLEGLASQSYMLVINPAIVISTTTLSSWTINLPGYNQTISATGGTGAYTFSMTAGTLPTGLTLSPGGVLSGTPTTTGTFPFSVTATDSTSAMQDQSYTVIINPAVSLATTPLASWTAGLPGYSQTI
ncbi:MAG TPA: putative Ig domain-containing protein, partial [Gemmataceae bacterium]|nr:putative Ig domain-containing protein [Gemmataceae bacterium]